MFKRRMAHFLHILLTKTLRNLFFTVFAFLNTQIKYEKSGNEVCILPKENGEVLKEEMKKGGSDVAIFTVLLFIIIFMVSIMLTEEVV